MLVRQVFLIDGQHSRGRDIREDLPRHLYILPNRVSRSPHLCRTPSVLRRKPDPVPQHQIEWSPEVGRGADGMATAFGHGIDLNQTLVRATMLSWVNPGVAPVPHNRRVNRMAVFSRCHSLLKSVGITLLVTLSATSCTSMRPLPAVSAPTAPKEFLDIKPGDRVSVELADGRRENFKVQSVEDDALISEHGQRYPRAEMLQLKRKRFSHAKTWSLVGASVFAVVVMYGIAVASAVDDLLSM